MKLEVIMSQIAFSCLNSYKDDMKTRVIIISKSRICSQTVNNRPKEDSIQHLGRQGFLQTFTSFGYLKSEITLLLYVGRLTSLGINSQICFVGKGVR